MSIDTTDGPVRLLHLSDLHFRAGHAWEAEPALRGLAEHVRKDSAAGLEPDLVVITGDLGFSGTREDYDLAGEWLARVLWPALTPDPARPLSCDRLLLVPGNHDVDRTLVSRPIRDTQQSLLGAGATDLQDAVAEVLGDQQEQARLIRRHLAWLDFYGDWLGLAPDAARTRPWWQRHIEIGGQRLHLAGLDSAWMAGSDDDRGRLLLGRYQLNQVIDTPECQDANWRLALLHHPWDYLADATEAREVLHLHRDLILHGHSQVPESRHLDGPDRRRTCVELAAGCAGKGGTHPGRFQWIELYLHPKRVRVHFRAWIAHAWGPDLNQPGCPDGIAEFTIAPEPVPPGGSPPTVPPEYHAWLQRTFGGTELFGLGAQQGRAATLSQVYCPAVTTPPPASGVADCKTSGDAGEPGEAPVPVAEDEFQGDGGAGDAAELRDPPPTLLLARLDATSLYCPAPPGAGKSTFCRWAALQCIAGLAADHPVPPPLGYVEPLPVRLRTRLPLLVPLREFWRTMDCGQGRRSWGRAALVRALGDWVDQDPPDGLSGRLLREHLETGGALLLFDGLDEVPVTQVRDGLRLYPRALILSGLAAALPHWQRVGNRILLTSRPYGLDAAGLARLDLPTAPLEPLPHPLQELFVTRWFHTLDRPDLTACLLANIAERKDLRALAENPLLLAALCVIYGNGGRLPEDRYRLYQRIVENVLYNRYPGDASEREPVKARLEAIAHGMHTGEGLGEDRRAPNATASDRELERLLGHFAASNTAYESGVVEPAVRREELLARSGLLLPQSGARAAFHHLSVQEYLAAERIARISEDRTALARVFRERGLVPEWRPTLVFLFSAVLFFRDAQWGLDLLTGLAADLDRPAVRVNPAPAVLVAEALDLCLAKGYRVPTDLADGFRHTCLDAIEDEIALPDRQTLGLCLGRLGDPRIDGLRDPAAYVEVPAGDYPYGEQGDRFSIVAPFLFGRYPVTNSQYRAFMDDGGYAKRDWWSADGWDWLQREGVTAPRYWQDRRWNAPNQPVVGVSFWEAQACCLWAGGRLPTEPEWEAAARGPAGWQYPWGDAWEDGICNSAEAHLGATSPVGLFPRARQAQLGLEDLAGNVLEWCESATGQPGAGTPRVLRGGAFDFVGALLRTTNRSRFGPGNRVWGFGFRCVLTRTGRS